MPKNHQISDKLESIKSTIKILVDRDISKMNEAQKLYTKLNSEEQTKFAPKIKERWKNIEIDKKVIELDNSVNELNSILNRSFEMIITCLRNNKVQEALQCTNRAIETGKSLIKYLNKIERLEKQLKEF
jgi:hypothetical protein